VCDSYTHNVNMMQYFRYELQNHLSLAPVQKSLGPECTDSIKKYLLMRIDGLEKEIKAQEKIMKKG